MINAHFLEALFVIAYMDDKEEAQKLLLHLLRWYGEVISEVDKLKS